MADRVVVFRKRLLSYSETFIADQGQLLPRYRPLYCGFQRDHSGLALIEASPRVLFEDLSRWPGLDKILFRLGLRINPAWLEALHRADPALIHAHFMNDGIDAIRLGRRLEVPTLTTLHGHDITKYDNATTQSRRTRDFFDQVTRVIAVSEFIAEQALQRGCPPDKLVQHYIGIDVQKFTLEKRETESPSLLFVGRLVEKKGCTYLLQAVARLRKRFPDLALSIIGEGELKTSLQREAAELGIEVEFAGTASASEIRQRLAQSWVFVAPSVTADDGDAEGLGMVFLEAQALRTPVVSFRSGGIVEAVADQESGLLCEEKDVDSLADNIAQLLDNSTLRRHMGDQGRSRVEQMFDIRKQCARLETIYDEIR